MIAQISRSLSQGLACRLASRGSVRFSSSSSAAFLGLGRQVPKERRLLGSASLAVCCTALLLNYSNDNVARAKGQVDVPVVVPVEDHEDSPTSASFKVRASLEVQEEMERVKMARFLKEIHDAVVQEGHHQLQKFKTAARLPHRDMEGILSLKGVDLKSLSPMEAWSIIEEMHKGAKLDRASLLNLLTTTTSFLKNDETLVDLRHVDDVVVVGDLHGCLESLKKVLNLIGDIDEDKVVVFGGDFVDRGEQSVEVLTTLLILKLAFPKNVILLRGNHEDEMVSSVYGFLDEVKRKYGPGYERVWKTVVQLFNALPIGARTETAFIIHGGISKPDLSLDEIARVTTDERSQISTVIDAKTTEEKLFEALLWSDPSEKLGERANPRGVGIEFGPDIANEFLTRHGLKYVVRCHEPVEKGVKAMPCGDGNFVVTVFSAAAYPNGEGHNDGAIIHLDKSGNCRSERFNIKEQPEYGMMLRRWVTKTRDKMKDYVHEQQENLKSKMREVLHIDDSLEKLMHELIKKNRRKLIEHFRSIEKDGVITKEQWVETMVNILGIEDVNWMELQPSLAPTTQPQVDRIDWREYMISNTTRVLDALSGSDLGTLSDNKDKLLYIFEYLVRDSRSF